MVATLHQLIRRTLRSAAQPPDVQVVPDAGMFMAGAGLPFLCGYYGSHAALSEFRGCLICSALTPWDSFGRCWLGCAGLLHVARPGPTLPPHLTSPTHSRPSHPLTAARLARQASLERFRLKKARRALAGGGKKIRYVARKVNADKRIRVKVRLLRRWLMHVAVDMGGD